MSSWSPHTLCRGSAISSRSSDSTLEKATLLTSLHPHGHQLPILSHLDHQPWGPAPSLPPASWAPPSFHDPFHEPHWATHCFPNPPRPHGLMSPFMLFPLLRIPFPLPWNSSGIPGPSPISPLILSWVLPPSFRAPMAFPVFTPRD